MVEAPRHANGGARWKKPSIIAAYCFLGQSVFASGSFRTELTGIDGWGVLSRKRRLSESSRDRKRDGDQGCEQSAVGDPGGAIPRWVRNWTAGKDGRGPWMRLRANAVQETDETELRWQAPRDKPSIWQRERHHIRSFEVIGADGKQYGSSVFECSKDDWR